MIQEACAKFTVVNTVVHILRFEILQNTWKNKTTDASGNILRHRDSLHFLWGKHLQCTGFQVYSYFTALGAAIQFKKYSGITVILITVVYCTLHTCFHVSHICSAECRDAQDHLVQFSIPFFDVIFFMDFPSFKYCSKVGPFSTVRNRSITLLCSALPLHCCWDNLFAGYGKSRFFKTGMLNQKM